MVAGHAPAVPARTGEQRNRPRNPHRARLYHLRVRHGGLGNSVCMILFFYNLALLAALVAGAPWWLSAWPLRKNTAKDCGNGWAGFRRLARHTRDRPLIWVHAVSVGEVLAVSRLVKSSTPRCPAILLPSPPPPAPARRLPGNASAPDRVFYCPLDLPWAVRAYLNALKPRLLILAETEFWPNLLNACFRRESPWPSSMPASPTAPGRAIDGARPFGGLFSSHQLRSGAERDRCRAAQGHRLPAPARLSRRKPEVRRARSRRSGRHPPTKELAGDLRWWWPAAHWKARKSRSWTPGPASSKLDPQLAMVLAPATRSGLAPWLSCSKSPVSVERRSEWRSGCRPSRCSRRNRFARHHWRAGFGLFAGRGGVCRRQPRTGRRTQSA